MEIRRGNNSEGELVPWLRRSALTDASAFYIRLRMTCASGYHFAATFTWMRSSEVDGRSDELQLMTQIIIIIIISNLYSAYYKKRTYVPTC